MGADPLLCCAAAALTAERVPVRRRGRRSRISYLLDLQTGSAAPEPCLLPANPARPLMFLFDSFLCVLLSREENIIQADP